MCGRPPSGPASSRPRRPGRRRPADPRRTGWRPSRPSCRTGRRGASRPTVPLVSTATAPACRSCGQRVRATRRRACPRRRRRSSGGDRNVLDGSRRERAEASAHPLPRASGSELRAAVAAGNFEKCSNSRSPNGMRHAGNRFLVASSPVIATHLQQLAPAAEVVLAPLSVDPRHYTRATLAEPIAGLIGTASWAPTAAAMQRLVRTVWPKVRKACPDARLLVAGRGVNDLLRDVREPGIEIVGEVASAADFLGGLSVLLYPLQRGSGMKVKVLEAIASGLPVVTTPAGSEGIQAGEGVVVQDDDDLLAEAAGRLLVDDEEKRARGAAAREAFDRRYTPEEATSPLVSLYERMVN